VQAIELRNEQQANVLEIRPLGPDFSVEGISAGPAGKSARP
jgi:hypothetical protein